MLPLETRPLAPVSDPKDVRKGACVRAPDWDVT